MMDKRAMISVTVVALCLSVVTAGQPVQFDDGGIFVLAVNEPADLGVLAAPLAAGAPDVWVPAENVVATWESVTAMSKLYNPAASTAELPERSLSLAARVDVVDVNGLLGFDSSEKGTLVLDEKFRVVYSQAVPERYCHFYWPLRYIKKMPTPGQWVSELQPYPLTVNMPLDPNHPYPMSLGRAEWSMYALVNTEAKTVDVPFGPSGEWLTLTPGVEIKVEQATAESGRYQYRLATHYQRSKVLWATSGAAIMIWTFDPTPEVIVTNLDILDGQGQSLKEETGSGSSTAGGSGAGGFSGGGSGGDGSADLITTAAEPSGDLMTGTSSGMGSYSGGGTATTFRFTLALKPRQQQLRFILENVPVPSL